MLSLEFAGHYGEISCIIYNNKRYPTCYPCPMELAIKLDKLFTQIGFLRIPNSEINTYILASIEINGHFINPNFPYKVNNDAIFNVKTTSRLYEYYKQLQRNPVQTVTT